MRFRCTRGCHSPALAVLSNCRRPLVLLSATETAPSSWLTSPVVQLPLHSLGHIVYSIQAFPEMISLPSHFVLGAILIWL